MAYRKWCFVPNCRNSSTRTPMKKFIYVPNSLSKKKKWFAAVGRDINGVSPKSSLYCCEDHFNLREDMMNYLQYKMMRNNRQARLKSDVVPHIFNWNPGPTYSQFDANENNSHTSTVDLLNELGHQSTEIGVQCWDSAISSEKTRDAWNQTTKVQFREKTTQVSIKDLNRQLLRAATTSDVKIDMISQPPVKRSRKQIFPSNIDSPSIEILYS